MDMDMGMDMGLLSFWHAKEKQELGFVFPPSFLGFD